VRSRPNVGRGYAPARGLRIHSAAPTRCARSKLTGILWSWDRTGIYRLHQQSRRARATDRGGLPKGQVLERHSSESLRQPGAACQDRVRLLTTAGRSFAYAAPCTQKPLSRPRRTAARRACKCAKFGLKPRPATLVPNGKKALSELLCRVPAICAKRLVSEGDT
jgi:hypothetical protein